MASKWVKIGLKRAFYRPRVLPPPPSCTSIFFFGEPLQAPKWCFFNSHMGVKKHHFGAPAGTRNKIIEVQDKKRAKKGGTPFLRPFWAILGDVR